MIPGYLTIASFPRERRASLIAHRLSVPLEVRIHIRGQQEQNNIINKSLQTGKFDSRVVRSNPEVSTPGIYRLLKSGVTIPDNHFDNILY